MWASFASTPAAGDSTDGPHRLRPRICIESLFPRGDPATPLLFTQRDAAALQATRRGQLIHRVMLSSVFGWAEITHHSLTDVGVTPFVSLGLCHWELRPHHQAMGREAEELRAAASARSAGAPSPPCKFPQRRSTPSTPELRSGHLVAAGRVLIRHFAARAFLFRPPSPAGGGRVFPPRRGFARDSWGGDHLHLGHTGGRVRARTLHPPLPLVLRSHHPQLAFLLSALLALFSSPQAPPAVHPRAREGSHLPLRRRGRRPSGQAERGVGALAQRSRPPTMLSMQHGRTYADFTHGRLSTSRHARTLPLTYALLPPTGPQASPMDAQAPRLLSGSLDGHVKARRRCPFASLCPTPAHAERHPFLPQLPS